MSEPTLAAVDLDLTDDGLVLTITPDEPVAGAPMQVRVGGTALRAALAPVMAAAFDDVRIAEAERLAELMHTSRHDVTNGASDRPDTYFAGMLAASKLACPGGHRGSLHHEAHQAAVARAVLADPGEPDLVRVHRDLRTLLAQVAALSDRDGARPEGWNEAISEVSLLITETVALLPGVDRT
ncbi:hypothetical protein [Cellulosimicrobium sp. Marseille-Q4280]|uniref:hypothetical protein n=1 Tax=Cellulosimicrobium sp. Marseille-Q4280 TaxID=2937992 RepID=UPI00203F5804|nr:hypothetical protein [Cellulosimicrobium sp. Marseille-Q4280]